jgi:hypothetical protein
MSLLAIVAPVDPAVVPPTVLPPIYAAFDAPAPIFLANCAIIAIFLSAKIFGQFRRIDSLGPALSPALTLDVSNFRVLFSGTLFLPVFPPLLALLAPENALAILPAALDALDALLAALGSRLWRLPLEALLAAFGRRLCRLPLKALLGTLSAPFKALRFALHLAVRRLLMALNLPVSAFGHLRFLRHGWGCQGCSHQ